MSIRSSNLVGWILGFNRQIAFLHISKTLPKCHPKYFTINDDCRSISAHPCNHLLLISPLKLCQLGIGEKISCYIYFLMRMIFSFSHVQMCIFCEVTCAYPSPIFWMEYSFCRIFRQGIIWSGWCLRRKIKTVWRRDWLEGWRVVRRLL